jgi:diguanylate cyclase (GGDEF)-like protein/putative nucleotidyltransferase with HDIG domain
MTTSALLSRSGQIYVSTVVAGGLFVLLQSMYAIFAAPIDLHWLMLALLTLLSGSFTVRIPGIPARLSVSETFVFAGVLMYGPPAATMIVALDTLVISFWLKRQSTPLWFRLAFNIAAAAVAIWAASHVFYYFTNMVPLSVVAVPILPILPWLLLLATLYFLFNSWLVAIVVGFQSNRSAMAVWRNNFLWLSLNYYSGASVAALLLPYLMQTGSTAFVYVAAIVLPVLLISYLTFKTALGRIDDANRHLSELNRLYLSTIETLAMAIDAKDQITHGHIRRVQRYAVSLARQIGITDPALISAIEAASLLHDMGKLAVPEYILNKPGKLTPAEFERMKLHASVGADILSAIEFPYPVVPIVRHHHENWNGTGYPDGLSGVAIPVGARILAVVDCFDALTSDRPYRPRLSDDEAIQIVLDRRGSMYDPVVVDAFITIQAGSAKVTDASVQNQVELSHLPDSPLYSTSSPNAALPDRSLASAGFEEITASTEETLVLYDLARDLSGYVDKNDVGAVIVKHLRRIVPASTCAFYVYEASADELVSTQVVGDHAPDLVGLRIRRGERLSGWVAANRQTILNSDPVLDLGDVGRLLKPRLHSCASTPLVRGQELIGVLTLYSAQPQAFTEDHRRILELVGRQVSQTVQNALSIERHRAQQRDGSTGISNVQRIDQLTSVENWHSRPADKLSVVFITVESFRPVVATFGLAAAEVALETIGESIKRALRSGDLLFRYGENEFVVLLTQTDADTARMVSERISSGLTEVLSDSKSPASRLTVALGVATASAAGLSVDGLIQSARGRERPLTPPSAIH